MSESFLTRQTNRRPRAVLRSPIGAAQGPDIGVPVISQKLETPADIGFRIGDAWRGRGSVRGGLSWACGNCGHLLLVDFAALPFAYPPVIECGQCGAYSEPQQP